MWVRRVSTEVALQSHICSRLSEPGTRWARSPTKRAIIVFETIDDNVELGGALCLRRGTRDDRVESVRFFIQVNTNARLFGIYLVFIMLQCACCFTVPTARALSVIDSYPFHLTSPLENVCPTIFYLASQGATSALIPPRQEETPQPRPRP